MRKRVLALLLVLLTAGLSGCVMIPDRYELLYPPDEIEQIALYDLRERGTYSVEEETPVGLLQPAQFTPFAKAVERLPFKQFVMLFPAAVDPNFYFQGYAVRITYKNGAYEVICAAGVQEYCDVDGKRRTQHLECDDEPWNALIERFFAVPDGQPDDAVSMGGGT